MRVGGETAHVDANLRDDGPCALAKDRAHLFGSDAKGCEIGLHLPVDRRDGGIESIDLPEMQPQQKAMVLGNAAT